MIKIITALSRSVAFCFDLFFALYKGKSRGECRQIEYNTAF